MDKTYKLVQWPDSQQLFENARFNECIFYEDLEGHVEVGSSAYMVPVDLYNEIFIDPLKPCRAKNVLKRLNEILKEHGNLELRSYSEFGELCPVIETEVSSKTLSPEISYFEIGGAPHFTISDFIKDITDALSSNPDLEILANGQSIGNYPDGYWLYPLETFRVGNNFLIIEGEDHSMDYTR